MPEQKWVVCQIRSGLYIQRKKCNGQGQCARQTVVNHAQYEQQRANSLTATELSLLRALAANDPLFPPVQHLVAHARSVPVHHFAARRLWKGDAHQRFGAMWWNSRVRLPQRGPLHNHVAGVSPTKASHRPWSRNGVVVPARQPFTQVARILKRC